MTIRIALIGFGKIARDEHWPAILANPHFELVAIATPGEDPEIGVPCFRSADDMFTQLAGALDAAAICTPPAARFAIAQAALRAGLHVLLEKPPATTLGELHLLEKMAEQNARTLFASWHAQYAPAVAQAAAALTGKQIASLRLCWREDVRKWHPGQQWIWQPGGFGVFDPGINALSIATRILSPPILIKDAQLAIPQNRQVPIAASIAFLQPSGSADFDWRPTDREEWSIFVEAADGCQIELHQGGSRLIVDGSEVLPAGLPSYPAMYARFAELCLSGLSDVDAEPLRIVADVLLRGETVPVESFD
jgi:D-galactose 1-dehydrogenase